LIKSFRMVRLHAQRRRDAGFLTQNAIVLHSIDGREPPALAILCGRAVRVCAAEKMSRGQFFSDWDGLAESGAPDWTLHLNDAIHPKFGPEKPSIRHADTEHFFPERLRFHFSGLAAPDSVGEEACGRMPFYSDRPYPRILRTRRFHLLGPPGAAAGAHPPTWCLSVCENN